MSLGYSGWLSRLVNRLGDGLDERRARRLRSRLGRRRRWLMSWHRDPDGTWQARLSAPTSISTVERFGTTRYRAVRRAIRALTRLLELQNAHGGSPGEVSGVPEQQDLDSPFSF